jgi:hypothetical protein
VGGGAAGDRGGGGCGGRPNGRGGPGDGGWVSLGGLPGAPFAVGLAKFQQPFLGGKQQRRNSRRGVLRCGQGLTIPRPGKQAREGTGEGAGVARADRELRQEYLSYADGAARPPPGN